MPVDTIELDELILDELAVTSISDAVAQPEIGALLAETCSCCLSYGCGSCSPKEPI